MEGRPINIGAAMVRLLGIHCGQFDEEMKTKTGIVTGRSGMTIALPIWHIVDYLYTPLFVERRKQVEELHREGRLPCAE
jgi:hypothetical protein